MNLSEKLSNLNIAIVAHFLVTAPPQELEAYLSDKVDNLLFIGHPLTWGRGIHSQYKHYYKSKLNEEKKSFYWKLPKDFTTCRPSQFLLYLKATFLTFLWITSFGQSFDLYIGVDSINAFLGVLLKRMGRVKAVVFYTIDYYPQRFDSKILNAIDQWLDRICLRNCDYVWNVSPLMAEAREKHGLKKDKTAPQLTVPIGVNLERMKRLPAEQTDRHTMVYMGRLVIYQGVELIIEALPDIINEVPEAKLIIIGTGPCELELRNKAKELRLEEYVTFTGFIESHEDVEGILESCAIGIAPYPPNPKSGAWYGDPGKSKQYLSCGLPVIITRVAWIAEEVERAPMGIAINYDKSELVNAAIKLLRDKEFYRKCRENATEFVSTLSWDRILGQAFSETLQVKQDI